MSGRDKVSLRPHEANRRALCCHFPDTAICADFGYDAFIVQHGKKLPALPTIAALGKNTSWGTEIETRNVLFLPCGDQ